MGVQAPWPAVAPAVLQSVGQVTVPDLTTLGAMAVPGVVALPPGVVVAGVPPLLEVQPASRRASTAKTRMVRIGPLEREGVDEQIGAVVEMWRERPSLPEARPGKVTEKEKGGRRPAPGAYCSVSL